MDALKRMHKFRRGDTLQSVTKKFGHRATKTTWDHAKNKSLRSKRKTPDGIEPRDTVFVPLTKAEVDAFVAEHEHYQTEIAAEMTLHAALTGLYARLGVSVASLAGTRTQLSAVFELQEKAILGAMAEARNAKLLKDIEAAEKKIYSEAQGALHKNQKLMEYVEAEAKVIGALAAGDVKAAEKAAGIIGKEAKAMASETKSLTKEIAKTASTIASTVTKVASPKSLMKMLVYSDVEEVDIALAKTEFGKAAIKALNTIRKGKAVSLKSMAALQKYQSLNLNMAEAAMKASEKRQADLKKRLAKLPTPSLIKSLS